MNVILFIHNGAGLSGRVFKHKMDQLYDKVPVDLYQDFKSIEACLNRSKSGNMPEIFVLFMDSVPRMRRFLKLVHYFEDKRVLLVLPDSTPATLSKTHKFRPRYFTYINDDYEDLCAVIQKIKQKGEENVGTQCFN